MSGLDRFKAAQDQAHAGFQDALSELRAGRKSGHWIWYVFPQLAGLGMSDMSQTYGIAGAGEAAEYLHDPVLRGRLLSAATVVADRLRAGAPIARLMGSSIDATKLVSSMTLFGAIARRSPESEDHQQLADVANEVLQAAETAGYPVCEFTLSQISPTFPRQA